MFVELMKLDLDRRGKGMEVFGGGASGKSPRYFISLASDNYLGDSHISVQQRDSACLIVKGRFEWRRKELRLGSVKFETCVRHWIDVTDINDCEIHGRSLE